MKRLLSIFTLAAICMCASCSVSRRAPAVMGPAAIHDTSVKPFDAARETAWPDFRLGGGLNVVVVNRNLPRTIRWQVQAGHAKGGISSSPVVYRNLILAASNDHNLYAIDATTGSLRWRYHDSDEVMTQPVYAHGLAVVAAGNAIPFVGVYPTYVVGGSGFNRISAVDVRTGDEVWGRRIDGTGMPTPAIVGANVIHADGSGTVLAFNLRTGDAPWATRLPSTFAMSSVVDGDDGRIYVSGVFTAAIYALRARDGSVVWRRMLSPNYQGTGDGPMASTKKLLVAEYLQALAPHGRLGWMVDTGSRVRHHIIALDKRTGRILWDTAVDTGIAPLDNQAAIPLIYRNRVYEGSAVAPVMSCLDLHTGRIIWQIHTGGPVKGGISALNGTLYFGDLGGYLWAVDGSSGHTIGRLRERVHFNVGSPIIVNDSLVDGSREGTVVAVPLRAIRDGRGSG
jgi:outer membrane protein assembly factor BamB